MAAEIKPVLKYTFVLNIFIGFGYGLTLLLISESFYEFIEHPFYDPVINVLLGAFILAMGFISFLSYRETDWEKVKNIVLMMIFLNLLSSIAFIILHFEMLFVQHIEIWINIGVFVLLTVLYVYSYFQQQK